MIFQESNYWCRICSNCKRTIKYKLKSQANSLINSKNCKFCIIPINSIMVIYGIKSSSSPYFKYIGITRKNLKKRLTSHKIRYGGNVRKWIKEQEKLGYKISINIIEEINNIEKLFEKEEFWINYHNKISPLLNIVHNNKFVNTEELNDYVI